MPTYKDLILQPKLNAVIRALYQASVDPQGWGDALRQMADLIGAPFTYAVLEGEGHTALLTHSEVTADAARYQRHCEALLAMQRAPKHLPDVLSAFDDEASSAADITPPAWSNTPLSSASITCAISAPRSASTASTASTAAVRLGVHFPTERATDSVDVNEAFALLEPHLRATLRMGQVVSAKRAVRSLLAQTLNVLPHGVLIITHNGQIIEANSVARSLLSAHDGVYLDDSGRARASKPTADALLIETFSASTSTPCALHLERTPPLPPLEALLIPLAGAPNTPLTLSLPTPTAFALLLHDPQQGLSTSPSAHLAERFGLTDAEHRVADALVKGLPTLQIAKTLNITPSTARTHCARVYQKVGVNDQADLIFSLLRSVWTLRDPHHPTTTPPRS